MLLGMILQCTDAKAITEIKLAIQITTFSYQLSLRHHL